MCGLRKANRNIKRYNGFLIPFLFGGHSELVPRLPIPNRTVKRLCADDSVDYPCESRSPPNSPFQSPDANASGLCSFQKQRIQAIRQNTITDTRNVWVLYCYYNASKLQLTSLKRPVNT